MVDLRKIVGRFFGPASLFRAINTAWMVGFMVIVAVFAPGCKKQTPPVPEPIEEAPMPPPRPLVTQEQFDKLLFDTPYKDVEEFFGMEPSRQESTYDEGVAGYTGPSLTSWYIWENPDGSFIKLGFINKKLTDMTSDKLPSGPTPLN